MGSVYSYISFPYRVIGCTVSYPQCWVEDRERPWTSCQSGMFLQHVCGRKPMWTRWTHTAQGKGPQLETETRTFFPCGYKSGIKACIQYVGTGIVLSSLSDGTFYFYPLHHPSTILKLHRTTADYLQSTEPCLYWIHSCLPQYEWPLHLKVHHGEHHWYSTLV